MELKISVIIATHKRPQILAKALQSLTIQTLPKNEFEVIVVDDNIDGETKKVIDVFAGACHPSAGSGQVGMPVQYYSCDAPGAGAKRNFGVLKSKADIILFLDDDMIASPNLLYEHFSFYNEGIDGVLGRVEEDKNINLNYFTKYLLDEDLQNTYKNINKDNVSFEYFYTGNISLKKDIFNKLGGFDLKFKQYGFEDSEFGYRFNKSGYVIKYNENALGYHHFLRNFEDYLARKRDMGRSAAYFAKLYPELEPKLSIHSRKLHEMLIVNGLTKNYWLNKVKELESKKELTEKGKKELYKSYEYLLNYYYTLGTRGRWLGTSMMKNFLSIYTGQKIPHCTRVRGCDERGASQNKIIATMIISNRTEPFLSACLECLNGCVDLVIINDNSSDKKNPNIETVKKSKLFAGGKVKLLFNEFKGFGDARNKYLDYLKEINVDSNSWLIKLDSDEVHPDSLRVVTRDILPNLPKSVGIVDTYYFHFMQSFDYVYSIDRRHDLFVRYNPCLYWEGAVHEKLRGQKGKRIIVPYLFYHYGYVNLKDDILQRWKLYARCGDNTHEDLDLIEKDTFLNWEGTHCIKFNEEHPHSMKTIINQMRKTRSEEFENYDIMINNHLKKNKMLNLKNFFRFINYRLRLYSRFMQCVIGFPGMWPSFLKLMK